MVEASPLGLDRLRISVDALPVRVPAFARVVPNPLLLPVFASVIPQIDHAVPRSGARSRSARCATGLRERHVTFRVGPVLPEVHAGPDVVAVGP